MILTKYNKLASIAVTAIFVASCQTPAERAVQQQNQIAEAEASLPAGFNRVTGDELLALFSDTTISGVSSRNADWNFTMFSVADGTIRAKASNGSDSQSDTGTWSIENDLYCSQFKKWVEGKRTCVRYYSNDENQMTISETEPGRIQDGRKLKWTTTAGNTASL